MAKAAVTGLSSAFGALLGGLVGMEVAEASGKRRKEGAVAGSAIGALLTGALAGASTLGDPEPKQIGISGPPPRFP